MEVCHAEQITKHPEVTMRVLESAGAQCGDGRPQRILTECPEEQFCALPGGEVCIYGIAQIPETTQITMEELARVVCPSGEAATAGTQAVADSPLLAADVLTLSGTFIVALVLGAVWGRRR